MAHTLKSKKQLLTRVRKIKGQAAALETALEQDKDCLAILQQIAVFRGDMDKRAGWGDHDMAAWQTFFDEIHKLGQISSPVKALPYSNRLLSNELMCQSATAITRLASAGLARA